jgi:hypothetical protein
VSGGLGGPRNRSGQDGEEKNLSPLQGIEPRFSGRSARSLLTILSEPTVQYEVQICSRMRSLRFCIHQLLLCLFIAYKILDLNS